MDRLFAMMAAYGLGVFSTAGAIIQYDMVLGMLVMPLGLFFIIVGMFFSMKYRKASIIQKESEKKNAT